WHHRTGKEYSDGELFDAGRWRRQTEGGPRGRVGMCRQQARGRDSVSSGAADRRLAVWLSLGHAVQTCAHRPRDGAGTDDGMSEASRYAAAEAFLRGHDEDWAALANLSALAIMTPMSPGSLMEPWCGRSPTGN